MKKLIVGLLVIFMIFSVNVVYAEVQEERLVQDTTSDILKVKDKATSEIEEYKEKYNSDTYGMTAYILNKARIFSIPLCFIGIIVGALYQYVLGTRRLDKKHKGFNLILSFVTLLVIFQVLPLIFAIIVTNWRG